MNVYFELLVCKLLLSHIISQFCVTDPMDSPIGDRGRKGMSHDFQEELGRCNPKLLF